MSAIITRQYEQWAASQTAKKLPARPDTFVFAYIPGQDPEAEISRDEPLPSPVNIVHPAPVMQYGMINTDAVVFSVVLDTAVGDFDYNWIGLVDSASNTLCMIVHTRTQRKIATRGQEQGNTLTRTLAMEFNGAAGTTQINVTPQTWQIDFSARLSGIDERQRLSALDIYGTAAFFGDGFLVTRADAAYQVNAGLGYVGGLRCHPPANSLIAVKRFPTFIWADASFQGKVTSRWETVVKLIDADALQDYIDPQGFPHYVTKLARINNDGSVTDLRLKGSQGEQEASRLFLRKDANLSDMTNQSAGRDNLGLGKLATKDTLTAHDVGAYTQGEADQKFFPYSGGTITGATQVIGNVTSRGGSFVFQDNDGHQTGIVAAWNDGSFAVSRSDSGRGFGIDKNGVFYTSEGMPIYEYGARVYSPHNTPTEGTMGRTWWWRDKVTGLIRQGGYVEDSQREGFLDVNFAIPFPNAATGFSFTPASVPDTSNMNISIASTTNSSMNIYHGKQEHKFYWEAVGY